VLPHLRCTIVRVFTYERQAEGLTDATGHKRARAHSREKHRFKLNSKEIACGPRLTVTSDNMILVTYTVTAAPTRRSQGLESLSNLDRDAASRRPPPDHFLLAEQPPKAIQGIPKNLILGVGLRDS
jgi:hypothetical protein